MSHYTVIDTRIASGEHLVKALRDLPGVQDAAVLFGAMVVLELFPLLCELQGLATELGVTERRFQGEADDLNRDVSSPSLVRDPAKCVLCGRCVRFTRQITRTGELGIVNRTDAARVSIFPGRPLNGLNARIWRVLM